MAKAPGRPLYPIQHHRVEKYQGYLIYGQARLFEDSIGGWQAVGVIYEGPGRVKEVHRAKGRPSGFRFTTREKAEEHAIRLCRKWVDRQRLPVVNAAQTVIGIVTSTNLLHSFQTTLQNTSEV